MSNDRNVTLEWTTVPNADGCVVRFGIAPDKLWQNIQLQGPAVRSLTTHVLNRGTAYHFRIDAFNANGITPGVP